MCKWDVVAARGRERPLGTRVVCRSHVALGIFRDFQVMVRRWSAGPRTCVCRNTLASLRPC